MPASRTFTVVDLWPLFLAAAPYWVNSPDPYTRWLSHRLIGLRFKLMVLALGAREVAKNCPTGYPRGPFPMTCSRYVIDPADWPRLEAAARRLAASIRGRL